MENKMYFCVTYYMTSGEQDITFKATKESDDHSEFKAKILNEVVNNKVLIVNENDYLFTTNIERVTFEGPYTAEELKEMYKDYY